MHAIVAHAVAHIAVLPAKRLPVRARKPTSHLSFEDLSRLVQHDFNIILLLLPLDLDGNLGHGSERRMEARKQQAEAAKRFLPHWRARGSTL